MLVVNINIDISILVVRVNVSRNISVLASVNIVVARVTSTKLDS